MVVLMENFDEYFLDVLAQLSCNASEEFLNNYITYTYSNELVNEHRDYFKRCMDNNLSPYKSLLFFRDYLNEK